MNSGSTLISCLHVITYKTQMTKQLCVIFLKVLIILKLGRTLVPCILQILHEIAYKLAFMLQRAPLSGCLISLITDGSNCHICCLIFVLNADKEALRCVRNASHIATAGTRAQIKSLILPNCSNIS